MNKLLILLFGVGLLTSSCNNEGCIDPTALNYNADAKDDDGSCLFDGSIALTIVNEINGEQLILDKVYTLTSGRKVKFEHFYYYISNLELLGSSNVKSDVVALVMPLQTSYNFGVIDAGNFTGIKFNLGLDSATNHQNPLVAPSPMNMAGMHWGWNPGAGYKFLRIEGYIDTTAAMIGNLDAYFEYHIATDPMLREVQIQKSLDVKGPLNLTLNFDLDHTFDNLDLSSQLDVHGGGVVADQLWLNLMSNLSVQ